MKHSVYQKKGAGFAVLVFPFAKSTLLSVTALYALYGLYLNLHQPWMVCLTEEIHGYGAFKFTGESELGGINHCWYWAKNTACFVSAMSCASFLNINEKERSAAIPDTKHKTRAERLLTCPRVQH